MLLFLFVVPSSGLLRVCSNAGWLLTGITVKGSLDLGESGRLSFELTKLGDALLSMLVIVIQSDNVRAQTIKSLRSLSGNFRVEQLLTWI